MSVCVHTCSINSQWGQNQDLYEKKEWNPKPCNPSKTWSFLGWATLLKSSVPHSNPFSLEKEFKSEDSVLVHWAFTSTAVGPPSLGRGCCQWSVFCSYFRGKALLLGREGNFPLKCFLSLSLSLSPLEIFNVQDLFLHRVHSLFYVVWLSSLLTKRHPRALLILAEGEECCLL